MGDAKPSGLDDDLADVRLWLSGNLPPKEQTLFALTRPQWTALLARLEAAEALVGEMVEALVAVSSSTHDGRCWCDVAIGAPWATGHGGSCVAARAALEKAKESGNV